MKKFSEYVKESLSQVAEDTNTGSIAGFDPKLFNNIVKRKPLEQANTTVVPQ